jgi:hypothetical protein
VGRTFEVRDLATGSEGKGPVGGAMEGLDGRGIVLPDILSVVVARLLFLTRF